MSKKKRRYEKKGRKDEAKETEEREDKMLIYFMMQ